MRRLFTALALALVVTACGGTSGAPEVATLEDTAIEPTTTLGLEATSDEDSLLQFAACMRENGVDVADPTVDAEGNVQLGVPPGDGEERSGLRTDEAFGAAIDTCGGLLEGLTFGFGERDITGLQDTLFEFAACMRDNGVDMPDPDFSELGAGGRGPGEGGGPFGDVDREDPSYVAAEEICGDLLAGVGPRGGGRGPVGGGVTDG
ncbi:MAG: hypothetical protein KJO18_08715 [Acidimicrobiia bacterium]|nr:hypothetical protein [Acidimicrobiia bacterium]